MCILTGSQSLFDQLKDLNKAICIHTFLHIFLIHYDSSVKEGFRAIDILLSPFEQKQRVLSQFKIVLDYSLANADVVGGSVHVSVGLWQDLFVERKGDLVVVEVEVGKCQSVV